MGANGISAGKIRKYIKFLKKSKTKYSLKQAYELIYGQIKQEGAFNEEDMEGAKDEIWSRLEENWLFEDKI